MNSLNWAMVIGFGVAGALPALADETASPMPDGRDAATIQLQNDFDHIGAEVHELSRDGRISYYIDEGDADDRAVVFIGGQGTSLEAFQLTEFARSMREELGLRVISVERNGFGESSFDPALGYQDYVEEVLAVLDHLGVDKFAIMAISGGGAYAAHLAAAVPDRVLSIHAGAAVSRTLPTRSQPDCSRSTEDWAQVLSAYTNNPKDWWGVPGSPVLVVPGWQTRAYADGTRSFYVGGQMGDASALAHEYTLICGENAVADVSAVTAPVYLYYGDADEVVTKTDMEQWQAAFSNVAKATAYPGEGHTVQYRHWDQILADMAGYDDYTVVCRDGDSRLIANSDRTEDDFLGICAWQQAD
ncbi:alpha/beta fold hydrolase [Paracoccus fistulariae]|uniref:Alpha/beta hydrolase n=1 Tax=Paracoccus fistulariae TaxID=658446 RepID=A0ABY7SMY1_9RHOB|nr:alpha/beta hydrolase [Paracoccus fistulariae]MDB6180270.1 alpha/beta hydrolase [Paracoccus fistulariae]WCR08353.1 alpha/beta hydrolase [Paracoccus fistulariae]